MLESLAKLDEFLERPAGLEESLERVLNPTESRTENPLPKAKAKDPSAERADSLRRDSMPREERPKAANVQRR